MPQQLASPYRQYGRSVVLFMEWCQASVKAGACVICVSAVCLPTTTVPLLSKLSTYFHASGVSLLLYCLTFCNIKIRIDIPTIPARSRMMMCALHCPCDVWYTCPRNNLHPKPLHLVAAYPALRCLVLSPVPSFCCWPASNHHGCSYSLL